MSVQSTSPGKKFSVKKITYAMLVLSCPFLLSACLAAPSDNAYFKRNLIATPSSTSKVVKTASTSVGPNGDVIDKGSCTKGLGGNLATGKAGQNLLSSNGLMGVERTSAPVAVEEQSAYIEPSPSSSATLRLKSGMTSNLLRTAYEQTGRHFKDGGQTPQAGFDDNGFTKWVYSQQGINISPNITKQIAGGRQVAKEDLRPGDLLVYRDNSSNGYHVGIYTGKGNFLHASPKTGVVTETAAFGPQYSPYFVGGRRYYDDPKATPLTDSQKTAAANSAVKVALSELGPSDKPNRQNYSKSSSSKKAAVKAKAKTGSKKPAVKSKSNSKASKKARKK